MRDRLAQEGMLIILMENADERTYNKNDYLHVKIARTHAPSR